MVLLDQQCIDQFAQQPPGARVDAAHDAEVQEHDPALAIDQQIAGVQVAVEQAVPQAALEGAEQQCLDQFGAVETLLADRGDVVDPHSLDAFHGQHALTGELPMHIGHLDIAAQRRGVQARHPGLHRLRLDPEVQLFGKVVGEVGDDVLGRQPPACLGQLDHLGEALEDLQIGRHPAPDSRALNFDDDVLAGVQGGVVHLGDRRRREWLLLEAGEQLRRIGSEFGLEQFVHLGGIGWRHRVEQAAKFP